MDLLPRCHIATGVIGKPPLVMVSPAGLVTPLETVVDRDAAFVGARDACSVGGQIIDFGHPSGVDDEVGGHLKERSVFGLVTPHHKVDGQGHDIG